MKKLCNWIKEESIKLVIVALIALFLYSLVGTSGDVEEIKERAPKAMSDRNWEVMRYEGWQRGSFGYHGGKVWYHVREIDDRDVQYRVFVTLWEGELHWNYGDPVPLTRINLKADVGQ